MRTPNVRRGTRFAISLIVVTLLVSLIFDQNAEARRRRRFRRVSLRNNNARFLLPGAGGVNLLNAQNNLDTLNLLGLLGGGFGFNNGFGRFNRFNRFAGLGGFGGFGGIDPFGTGTINPAALGINTNPFNGLQVLAGSGNTVGRTGDGRFFQIDPNQVQNGQFISNPQNAIVQQIPTVMGQPLSVGTNGALDPRAAKFINELRGDGDTKPASTGATQMVSAPDASGGGAEAVLRRRSDI